MRHLCIKERNTHEGLVAKVGYFYSIYVSARIATVAHSHSDDGSRLYINMFRIPEDHIERYFIPIEDFSEEALFALSLETGVTINEIPESFMDMISKEKQ